MKYLVIVIICTMLTACGVGSNIPQDDTRTGTVMPPPVIGCTGCK